MVSRAITNPTVSSWAAQCDKFYKWRMTLTHEEFEEIRSMFVKEPFNFNNKPNSSCDDLAGIEYDSSKIWAIDQPNLPKPPSGFKRELYLRTDYSKMDVYYITPTGKKLRSITELDNFLQQDPEFSDISISGDALRNARMSKLHIPVDDAKCCLSGDNMETQLHLFSEYSWTTRVKAELEMFGQESQHKGERWNNVYFGFKGGTRNSSRRILQQQFGVPGYITLGKRELEVL
ncbi:hypothetical protein CQW23_18981 [Capsicum baccatum]|uniref:MBD domain-containing protein n=1 Tax=Capsicum baccatum TaxID=33114 RepID=A0A2G2W4G8_CAPBA|nr:hypothetical protein CQW23_18981 [Capsicum baccatum]